MTKNCFLCGENTESIPTIGDLNHISCPTCGDIFVTGSYYATLGYNPQKLSQKEKVALSYYYKTHTLKNINNSNEAKTLSDHTIESILSSVNYPSSLLEKIDLVLGHIYTNTEFLHRDVIINMKRDYRRFFCFNRDELQEIIDYLKKMNYIRILSEGNERSFHLLPDGIKHIEESGKNSKSDQCFVAMWFNDNMQKVYADIIKPAIIDVGYNPMKIDNKEHVNYITDEIIKEIRRSKFMVADLTGYRGGVYYEAGFAFGLGIPVIFTCHEDWKDDIKEDGIITREGVHFDIKHRNMIFWKEETLEEFKKALINRIGAVVGLNEKERTPVRP